MVAGPHGLDEEKKREPVARLDTIDRRTRAANSNSENLKIRTETDRALVFRALADRPKVGNSVGVWLHRWDLRCNTYLYG